MVLTSRSDDWDDLTELLEDLSDYYEGPGAGLYPVVQAIAEGREAYLNVPSDRVDEFKEHMREFRIDAKLA